MKQPFHADDSVLIDYLDNNLSEEEQSFFEEHLTHCPKCREKVALQRAWLTQLEQSKLQEDPEKVADLSTLTRVREALLSDISTTDQTQLLHATQNRPSRRVSWLRLSGFAAAVLVVAVLVPLLVHHWNPPSKAENLSVIDVGNYDQEPEGQTSPAIIAVDDGRNASDQGDTWRVYNGALADLSTMQMFFETLPPRDQTETTEKTAVDETGTEESTIKETTIDFFQNNAVSLSPAGQSLLEAMQQAESVQIAVRQNNHQQIMILASYPIDDAKKIKEVLDESLATCQEPIMIEIIRYADLTFKLDAYEDGLANRLLPESRNARQTWILVLIGA